MSKYFKCTTNKNPLTYTCGEKIIFYISAKEKCIDTPCKYFHWKIAGDDGKVVEGLGEFKPGNPVALETTLDKPGFVRISCTAYNDNSTIDNSFDVLDAGAGADVDKIEYADTIPDDFDDYWQEIEKLVADFNSEVLMCEPVENNVPDGFKAFELRISTPDGRPASGFVTMPVKDGKYPIQISFMGYSIAGTMPVYKDNYICATFNAHGFENNLNTVELKQKYFHELAKNKNGYSYGFDPEENASNMTTYWRNVMIRNLIGAKYIKSLSNWDGKNLLASGGSQAALQATTLAAHDKDVTMLEINIPWFCNLNAENKGFMPGWRPKFAEGLRYFDTVAQATRVNCPVKINAKIFDFICPPATVMALYNAFKTNKQICFTQSGTHGYNPPEVERFYLQNDPENPNPFEAGKYKHYKGGEYELLYTATSSENYCEKLVIYRSLEDGKIWVRPAYMWNELVMVNGQPTKRFEKM